MVPTLTVLLLAALGRAHEAGVMLAGGLALAGTGLWDDFRDLGVTVRLVVHVVAAVSISIVLGDGWSLPIFLVAGILIVWHVNLFNFMDGIDGIASVQVLLFCAGILVVGSELEGWSAGVVYVLIGACLGFLAFNWAPAAIFMGDVSSGFLGAMTAFLAIMLHEGSVMPIACSAILLSGFWCDASYTLLVRVVTRQQFLKAHRNHLYQHLARSFGHRWTATLFLLHGLVWLFPIAWLAALQPEYAVLWLCLSILPITCCCWYFKAGFPEGGSLKRRFSS